MFTIDPDLTGVLDAYFTCEFTTLGRDGTPLTWPTAVLPRPDGTLLVTTCVAFPQKALNIRRDGRVALLFSDPTGSGLTDAPQVFVSGHASCPEEIVTSTAGLEKYWGRLFQRQPSSKLYVKFPINKLMDWYYFRWLITIEPDGVAIREPIASIATEPAAAGSTGGGGGALLGADILARFPTAVLGAVDAAGAPLLMRTTVTPVAEGFEVRAEPDAAVVAGPASLLVHRHDEKLSAAYTALVPGRLSELGEGRWLLVPDRVIEPIGTGLVSDALRLSRDARRATKRYLDRRGLDRPSVPWGEYRKLAAGS
jgi:hypothetical protein